MTTPTPLQPYDRSRLCVKCGASGASTEFWPSGESDKTPKPDRMRRVCRECKHIWFELPLDAAKPYSEATRLLHERRDNGPAPLHRKPDPTPAPPPVRTDR